MASNKGLWLGLLGGLGILYLIFKPVSATPSPPEVYFCTLEEYNAFLNDFEGTPEEFIDSCRGVANWIEEYEGCPVSFYGSHDLETDMVYLECRSNCNGHGQYRQ